MDGTLVPYKGDEQQIFDFFMKKDAPKAGQGRYEIYFHPATSTKGLIPQRMMESRVREWEILRAQPSDIFGNRRIRLANYLE